MVGYGTLYRFEYDATCNPFGTLLTTKCKLLILKKDYAGAITDIPYGQASPVEIDYPTADDDLFYPLKGSVLSFKVLGGVINMDSIISEDEKEYFVEYYRDNVLFWSGFVSPELCEEDIFLRYPAIEFKTIDGLGTLKDKVLKINNKYPSGILSLLTIVQNALNSIGYGYGLNVLCKTWFVEHTKTAYSTPLEQTYIYTASLQDKNFEFKDNSDIVVDTCLLFNSIVYQNYGEWYFVKPKDLAFGVNQASKFSVGGTLNTSSKKTIPTLVHGTDFLIVAEPKRKVRRFYKEVEIEYQRGDSRFINGNFNIWDGTATEIPYTNVLDLNGGGLTQTNFKFITNYGASTYLLYDSVSDSYYLGLTGSVASEDGVGFKPISILWKNGFNLNIKTITSNPSFSVGINPYESSTVGTKYFNFSTGEWQSSEYIFTKSVDYPDEDLPVFNYDFPFPDVLDALEIYKYTNYLVSINLYSQPRTDFTGNQTIYQQVLLNGNGNYLVDYSGTWPVFYTQQSDSLTDNFKVINSKPTSITPEKKIVYNGDSIVDLDDIFNTNNNFSDLHYLEGSTYTRTIAPYKFGGLTIGGWYERDEYDPLDPPLEGGVYGINELTARNTLNQYSDYRNIFMGTIIGKNLQYGAVYEFPMQGALAGKKFWPLSMKLNERDCTADVVFMELSTAEQDFSLVTSRYDTNGNLISSATTESKKKSVME